MTHRYGNRTKVIAALAAIVTAVSLVFAVSSPLASSSGPAVVQHIRLFEREVAVSNVDNGAHGLSAGDQHLIHSAIRNTDGKVIGSGDFVCTATAGGRLLSGVCQAALRLPGGQIVGQFAFGRRRAGSPMEQAITGGTGSYEGAHGEFVLGKGTSKRTPFTIELVD